MAKKKSKRAKTAKKKSTKKKSSKKRSSSKKTKKKSKKKASASSASAPTPEPEDEEVDTYIFCRHPKSKYIPRSVSWTEFREGLVEQMRFHQLDMPDPAQKTEIELFAARLDKYLLGLGYAGTEGARYYIRGAVGEPTDPMQNLLDVVAENYRP